MECPPTAVLKCNEGFKTTPSGSSTVRPVWNTKVRGPGIVASSSQGLMLIIESFDICFNPNYKLLQRLRTIKGQDPFLDAGTVVKGSTLLLSLSLSV